MGRNMSPGGSEVPATPDQCWTRGECVRLRVDRWFARLKGGVGRAALIRDVLCMSAICLQNALRNCSNMGSGKIFTVLHRCRLSWQRQARSSRMTLYVSRRPAGGRATFGVSGLSAAILLVLMRFRSAIRSKVLVR